MSKRARNNEREKFGVSLSGRSAVSTNQKVIKEQENSQGRYQKEMPQTLFCPSVNRNRGKADNVYFANRLRRPVLGIGSSFAPKIAILEAFI